MTQESSGRVGLSTRSRLQRTGAVAAIGGSLLFLAATLAHPMTADPHVPAAAFAEYAADRFWVLSHLAQFVGVAVLGVALLAFADLMEPGRPAAWGQIARLGTTASVTAAAALQAVDGVALKVMVDRWAQATGPDQARAFEAAFAVRQIEIGLASLLSLLFGLTVLVFGIAALNSRRVPRWLGLLALLAGIGNVAGGIAQGHLGFSSVPMALSMWASMLLLAWVISIGVFMWRLPSDAEPPVVSRTD